eukprot:gb/GECG01010185.1/.p1 GENE.gb/GECG01010185.1/~~gb/GECG01010185.1/.p1  ORF type:complete len:167 (+),score=13.57 gb/GECG01010185.1/:1-501(+)
MAHPDGTSGDEECFLASEGPNRGAGPIEGRPLDLPQSDRAFIECFMPREAKITILDKAVSGDPDAQYHMYLRLLEQLHRETLAEDERRRIRQLSADMRNKAVEGGLPQAIESKALDLDLHGDSQTALSYHEKALNSYRENPEYDPWGLRREKLNKRIEDAQHTGRP